MRAGTGRFCITPPAGIWLAGFGIPERRNTGVVLTAGYTDAVPAYIPTEKMLL